jgi:hypothetical protein
MAALVAAIVVFVIFSLPPSTLRLAARFSDGTLPGIIHVHTNRSDGRGTPDDVAAAAARAGLKFVVFTDHGDATRRGDPPVYRSGVLCIDAVEISTTGGHYIALDMPPAPYPLGGEARDVVEDVKRLGGFGIVAHPNSPKPALSWRAWETPFDALEWINPDTSWRLRLQGPGWRSRFSLVQALFTYPFRSTETLARLLAGSAVDADRWDAITKAHRVVAVAGADAHNRLALGGSGDPGDARYALPFPAYDVPFRTMSLHVEPDRALSGDAAADAAAILAAIRRGHLYTAIDGLASPPSFQFTATNRQETARQGDMIAAVPATLGVRSNLPASFRTVIWAGNRMVTSTDGLADFVYTAARPAVYRVEVQAPSEFGPVPWVVSNPIYVGVSYSPEPASAATPASLVRALFDGHTSAGWWTEADPLSARALEVPRTATATELRFRYALAGGSSSSQHVTLAVSTPRDAPFDRLRFTLRGERPMRVSVQLRAPTVGDRWQRSVYVDDKEREYSVDVNDMVPIGNTRSATPDLNSVRDLLFVIETTNAKAGASGLLWITSAVVQKINR